MEELLLAFSRLPPYALGNEEADWQSSISRPKTRPPSLQAQSASAWRTITNAFCSQVNAGFEELSTGTLMPSFPDICFTDAALCCPPCQVKVPCFVWPTVLFTPDTIHFRLTWRAFPPTPLSLNSERSGPEIQASSFSWTLPVTRLT